MYRGLIKVSYSAGIIQLSKAFLFTAINCINPTNARSGVNATDTVKCGNQFSRLLCSHKSTHTAL